MKDLSIIVVNWNTRDLLRQCLEAVETTVHNVEYELIVIDNGSSDGSLAMLQEAFPHAHLVANATNEGFARANNQGIRASSGRYVLLLNSDTKPLAGALDTLVGFLDRHQQCGIVGSRLLNGDGSLQRSWAKFPTLWSEICGQNVRERHAYSIGDETEAYAVDWVGGACLLIRRATIDQIGLLDERFFMYSEELDWCFRAKRSEWDVCYYPAAKVTHFGGQSSRKASTRMKAELYKSKQYFFAKHYGALYSVCFRFLLQALFLGRAVLTWLLALGSAGRQQGISSPWHDSLEIFRAVSRGPRAKQQ